MKFTVLLNFLIAIAVGALIGIERQRGAPRGFAGLRTFVLISFLGAVTGFLYINLRYVYILPTVFFSLAAIIVISYFISAKKGFQGITAEVTALIVFFLGFFVMFENFKNYSLIFCVLITILLSFKGPLHSFVEKTKDFEWRDTLMFALIAFVILPLLPKEVNLGIFPEGKFYDLNIINPREIWWFVVFVTGVSFIGYFIVKRLGDKKGAPIVGAVGGMVSSTAVTQSMASYSKQQSGKKLRYKSFSIAVLLATIVSFIRLGLIAIGVNIELISLALPILLLIAIGIIIYSLFSKNGESVNTKLELSSPFKLKPALILGALYALLTFVSKLSIILDLGKVGLYVTAIITGFFEVDPVILSVSKLSEEGVVGIEDAIVVILLGIASNQLTKTFIARANGTKKFGRCVASWLLTFVFVILGWIAFMFLA